MVKWETSNVKGKKQEVKILQKFSHTNLALAKTNNEDKNSIIVLLNRSSENAAVVKLKRYIMFLSISKLFPSLISRPILNQFRLFEKFLFFLYNQILFHIKNCKYRKLLNS